MGHDCMLRHLAAVALRTRPWLDDQGHDTEKLQGSVQITHIAGEMRGRDDPVRQLFLVACEAYSVS